MTDCNVCIGTNDYDEADFYTADMRKARKPHRCCECRQIITPGSIYESVRMATDGEFQTYQTCHLCVEIRNAFTCGKGWLFTVVWEDMEEYAFPELTTASKCFQKLSPEAKQFVLDRWNKWKFGRKQ